jgi:hypothetical protein
MDDDQKPISSARLSQTAQNHKLKSKTDNNMTTKKTNTKTTPKSNLPTSKPETSLEAPRTSRESEGDICTVLTANASKVNSRQPVLLGLVKFGELAVSLSLWWQETQNGQRDYYSMTIQDAVKAKELLQRKEQVEPLARLKLYQFRQNSLDDPDYASSAPFVHEGRGFWALLWVEVPDFADQEKGTEQDLRRMKYYLVFSPHRPQEKWEKGLMDTLQNAQQHLLTRRAELEERKLLKARRVQQQAEFDADELP